MIITTRFDNKVNKTRGCWLWTAGTDCGGYGVFRLNGKIRKAHRVSYEMAYGAIPNGLTLDHLCRTRRCVRPEHLEAVSLKTNILRGAAPSAINARKTECNRGHVFNEANTYAFRSNRQCRLCYNHIKRERRRIKGRDAVNAENRQSYYRNWEARKIAMHLYYQKTRAGHDA